MKTHREREQQLRELARLDRGRQEIVGLWKKYTHSDPGHWQPAEGWDFPSLIRDIVRHEYAGSLSRAR